ncbi:MAG: nucleoside-diphosphate sugar epimerase/dehydratase [Candidatus Krumholzibacteriota bacterium]|nr:nucleoside-diphosphate sugar epimerase/dehydratase [Candidatus Krumholzibacteriota bacterium]
MNKRKRILIVGAGEAARMVVSRIKENKELGLVVVGLLDDNPDLDGKKIDGIPVFGKTSRLEEFVLEKKIDEIIIAIPTAPRPFVRNMIHLCGRAGTPYKIVPGVMEIIKGDVSINQIREVRVEDLLGRETVDFELDYIKPALSGKRVLVTGAGGTIGSELCRYISYVNPAELILLGRGENRIFEIEEELKTKFKDIKISTVINNLRNPQRTKRLIATISPDIIYHTAAHKHVHYMEEDPEEAIINNVGTTLNLARASAEAETERFVFISTDKAANPRGVMGASKRVMELYFSTHGRMDKCRFISVRFGNVIGSAGSVVPLFLKQIERGGPVTVSHPQAARYFMTVKEAALLVLEASVMGDGGEIFILDMGEAINILEMAKDIIVLTGHIPEKEISIEFTGLRPGEKLLEELVNVEENLVSSEQEKIFLARSSSQIPAELDEKIEKMVQFAVEGKKNKMLEILRTLVAGLYN